MKTVQQIATDLSHKITQAKTEFNLHSRKREAEKVRELLSGTGKSYRQEE